MKILTCGRIHTIGFLRDNDFVFEFGGNSLSSCKPPRDIMPLHPRILFGKVPFEIASIDRGRDNVDKWSLWPFICVPPFGHSRIFNPPSNYKCKTKREYKTTTVIHVNIVYFYQENEEEQAERLLWYLLKRKLRIDNNSNSSFYKTICQHKHV